MNNNNLSMKRFAYVPMQGKFRFGVSGTVTFTKIDEDYATCPEGLRQRFDLYDHCWMIDQLMKQE